jgi:hypothetical protein
MSFDWLYRPAESLDTWLSAGLDGAGLLVVIVLALLLGLRHATDPDHLVAVGALISGDQAGPRDAARIGAWWGIGHAATLVAVGIPLIALDATVPAWLASAAETAIGVLIVALAARVGRRWWQRRRVPRDQHLTGAHRAPSTRSARGAVGIGILHGLGGTGAIVLLLVTALPTAGAAIAALAIFASTSAISMALCTGAYTWVLTRRRIAELYLQTGVPALVACSMVFGGWYGAAGWA